MTFFVWKKSLSADFTALGIHAKNSKTKLLRVLMEKVSIHYTNWNAFLFNWKKKFPLGFIQPSMK